MMRSLILLSTTFFALMITGCSSVKVWPFDSSRSSNTSAGKPTNANEYQCEGGKRFYVRLLDNGNTAWLIYPDREVGLTKAASTAGARYSNGVAVLVINNNEATLNDGAKISYTGCKATVTK